jgi:hypothetical protein
MLPGLNLPVSLLDLLGALRPVFTGPSFVTFCGLVAGAVRAGAAADGVRDAGRRGAGLVLAA